MDRRGWHGVLLVGSSAISLREFRIQTLRSPTSKLQLQHPSPSRAEVSMSLVKPFKPVVIGLRVKENQICLSKATALGKW